MGKAGVIRENVLNSEEVEWILKEAIEHGMTVMPMTNVLYHMEHFLCQERYAHL